MVNELNSAVAELAQLRQIVQQREEEEDEAGKEATLDEFLVDNEVYPGNDINVWLEKIKEKATSITLHASSEQTTILDMARRVLSTINKRPLPKNKNGDYFCCAVDMLRDMLELLLEKVEIGIQNVTLNDRLSKQVIN